ncbi:LPS-assembly protein LptD [Weeksellaceae bacterium TAE3-ERU29]|nr:LPS-assembly protein LptD [Weeksellaceae bacterium TAE3-ERU29]
MDYNVFNRVISIIFISILGVGYSQTVQDTVIAVQNSDTLTVRNFNVNDSIRTDSIPQKKRGGMLQATVDYSSENVFHDVKNKKSFLERDAKVHYLDIDIEADFIEVDWETGILYAEGKKDSIGKLIEPSKFTQGGNTLEYDNFTYNIKTKKGTASNIRTQQNLGGDEGVLVAKLVKRYNDTISGLRKIAFTTDQYFMSKKDTVADYSLQAEVAKFIQGKDRRVVTGPVFMKMYDVTTPLFLPFSFIPMGTDRSTGLLLPSFGERESVGFYIEGAGIYIPIGDYLDLAFTGDIYTKGSYGLHARSQYIKRYKFSGNFSLDWERRVSGIKGLNNYSNSKLYRIYWSHRQDSKANPNLIFSANVNFTSSTYYQNGINNYNLLTGDVLRNSAQSSISLSKTFPDTPFSANLNLSHSQNFGSGERDNSITFTAPTLVVNMSRIYPFAPKVGSKKGLLQNIGMTYNMNLQNIIRTNDENVFTKRMFDDAKNGVKHNLNLSTGTTIFNYFPVNFSANYEDVWYLKTIRKDYDPIEKKVVTTDVNGFSTFRTFGLSTGVQTTLYGIKVFGSADDNKWIKAIRHVMSPSIGFSYTPDFSTKTWDYYDSYINEKGEQVLYSKFEGGIYGSPSRGLSESLNFSLSNNLEMKVRSIEDSTGVKKIKLLDYLNLSTGYNFAAEEFKLSPISINGATSILDSKMRINFSATVNPYQVVLDDNNPNGRRVDKLGFEYLSITNYNIGLNYSLNDKTFGERKIDYPRRGAIRDEVYYFDDEGYAQYLTPWNLSIGLNHSVNKNLKGEANKTTSMNLNGRLALTPYWDISGSTNIDLETGEISYTRISFNRDLRSFRMNFSMVPFGQYKTWNFFIGIKASFLSDTLKHEERSFNVRTEEF